MHRPFCLPYGHRPANFRVMSTPSHTFLDVTLYPHRSLGRRGFTWVMLIIGGISLITGVGFMLAGAWPVIGFLGLEVLLVWWFFRVSYRSAGICEHIQLFTDELRITRDLPNGTSSSVTYQPYWAQVELKTLPDGDTRLFVGSHGKRTIIGAFLSADERAAFADVLQDGIARSRSPRHAT